MLQRKQQHPDRKLCGIGIVGIIVQKTTYLEFFQAQREEFSGLQRTVDPFILILQIALATTAEIQCGLFRDAFGDVDVHTQAVHAHVGGVWSNGCGAFAT